MLPEIKAKILETFTGIEEIKAGSTGSLSGQENKAFGEGTRGRAAKNRSGQTSIGLQIQGAKVAATEETVAHETGHVADMALGGGKGLASKQEGTFQFDLVEKGPKSVATGCNSRKTFAGPKWKFPGAQRNPEGFHRKRPVLRAFQKRRSRPNERRK